MNFIIVYFLLWSNGRIMSSLLFKYQLCCTEIFCQHILVFVDHLRNSCVLSVLAGEFLNCTKDTDARLSIIQLDTHLPCFTCTCKVRLASFTFHHLHLQRETCFIYLPSPAPVRWVLSPMATTPLIFLFPICYDN